MVSSLSQPRPAARLGCRENMVCLNYNRWMSFICLANIQSQQHWVAGSQGDTEAWLQFCAVGYQNTTVASTVQKSQN